MTCDHALELLLEADLAELDGVGGSLVAAHVRDCARCRVVAARVAMDTRALARAHGERQHVTRPSGARPPYGLRPVAVAGALAAAVVFVVFGARRVGDAPRTPAAVPSLAVMSRPMTTPSVQGAPVTVRRFADPVAATPVRLVASHSVAVRATGDVDGVTVTAPEGTRVAVLKTGNAAITVVWLY